MDWLIGKAGAAGVAASASAPLSQQPRHALGARGALAPRVHGHASHERLRAGAGHTGVTSGGQLGQAAHGVGVGVGAQGGGCRQAGAWEAFHLGAVVSRSRRRAKHHSNYKQQAQGRLGEVGKRHGSNDGRIST